LRANQLSSLPRSLTQLVHLEKLDLRWNKALSIPRWIVELEARGCLVYT
jgi:hypothetical protein